MTKISEYAENNKTWRNALADSIIHAVRCNSAVLISVDHAGVFGPAMEVEIERDCSARVNVISLRESHFLLSRMLFPGLHVARSIQMTSESLGYVCAWDSYRDSDSPLADRLLKTLQQVAGMGYDIKFHSSHGLSGITLSLLRSRYTKLIERRVLTNDELNRCPEDGLCPITLVLNAMANKLRPEVVIQ